MKMKRYSTKKYVMRAAAVLLLLAYLPMPGARAAVVEAEPDLQAVIGDLLALSVAARLYYDDTREARCPSFNDLARYLKKPFPVDWTENCRTADFNGEWWIGRKVPEFSRARKFLRSNASMIGLYEQRGGDFWLGGSFVWFKAFSLPKGDNAGDGASAVRPVILVAKGGGNAGERLFFRVLSNDYQDASADAPRSDYYWWSDLFFAPGACAAALKKFGARDEGPFLIPPVPAKDSETLKASPVYLPPEFNLRDGEDEEEEQSLTLGNTGIQLNPIPRKRQLQ
jgi:hypothetical protein